MWLNVTLKPSINFGGCGWLHAFGELLGLLGLALHLMHWDDPVVAFIC
jgi:hypothetical protein